MIQIQKLFKVGRFLRFVVMRLKLIFCIVYESSRGHMSKVGKTISSILNGVAIYDKFLSVIKLAVL